MNLILTKAESENLIKALQVAVIVQSSWWRKHFDPKSSFSKTCRKSSKKFSVQWQKLACKLIKQAGLLE